MADSQENESEFEVIDRKSSTSDSFEAVDDKKTDSQSISENEEEKDEKNEDEEVEEEENEVEEGKLPFVDQSIKDDAERAKNEKDGEMLVEEALNAPIRPDQEQFYTAEASRRAITLLIAFSAMMFTLPLLTMATLYYWVFIDHFHLPPSEAMLYSGIGAAVVVILIAAAFCYMAWKEEKDAEEKLKKEKKKE